MYDVTMFTHVEFQVERHSFCGIKTLNDYIYSVS